jgi:hypothetical protein
MKITRGAWAGNRRAGWTDHLIGRWIICCWRSRSSNENFTLLSTPRPCPGGLTHDEQKLSEGNHPDSGIADVEGMPTLVFTRP